MVRFPNTRTFGFTGVLLLIFVGSGIREANNTPQVWYLEEEVRIGVRDGTGPELFGNINGLSLGPHGHIYVYERQVNEIRVFDKDGNHIHTFCREGAGPGELKSVTGIAWDPQDRLWIIDGGNSRYSVFDTTGTLIKDYLRPVALYSAQWVGGFDNSGHFYDQTYLQEPSDHLRQALIQYDPVSQSEHRIPLPDFTSQSARLGSMWLPVPFARELKMRFDPAGYIWYGVNDEYEIKRMGFDGETISIIQGPREARSLTRAERDSVRSYIQLLVTQYGQYGLQYKESIIPRAMPIYEGIYINEEGSEIWVKLIEPENAQAAFDVFNRSGQYLGEALSDIPIAASPAPIIRGDEIWLITTDELDVPYVVRARVVR